MPDVTNYLAWWGAGLSTLLAFVKPLELWSNRFRIDIGYIFTTEPNQGNQIHIRNLSSKAIILEHWELYYCKRRWLFNTFKELESPTFDIKDIQIPAHSSKTLYFKRQNHFNLQGKTIYIKLCVAGKKPFYKKVFP